MHIIGCPGSAGRSLANRRFIALPKMTRKGKVARIPSNIRHQLKT